jgi:hypothetical protein
MKLRNDSRFLAIAMLAALLSTGMAAHAQIDDDGLEQIKVRDMDKAFRRPGASLAAYNGVLLKPVSIAFSKSWNPRDYGGSTFGLSTKDVEKIRSDLARLAESSFRTTLTRGGYSVSTTPGPGVLEVEARIVDLVINAPEMQTSSLVRSYVMSVGEMRLNAELRDSVTGTLLYRVSDKKRGPTSDRLEWASNAWNKAELATMLDGWAIQLKEALDAAREPVK